MAPDWIPNIHPFIVHFPVALLIVAVIFDLLQLYFRENNWIQQTVLVFYGTGTLGLIASFLTGREAVKTVAVAGDAIPLVNSHEDWALYTLLFFSVFTILKFWIFWKQLDKNWTRLSLIILSVIGVSFLWKTGEMGAKLVYNHGVAVGEVERLQDILQELEKELSVLEAESAPLIDENGSWIWRIVPGADKILTDTFLIKGSVFSDARVVREDGQYHLELSVSGQKTFLLVDRDLSRIEGQVELNIEEFEGEFDLVHHYQNPELYQFLRLDGSNLIQGRVEDGRRINFQTGTIETGSWMTLRVTKSGQHFYGYQNEQTITHSHSDEMKPGKTGVAVSGKGILKIRVIGFTAL